VESKTILLVCAAGFATTSMMKVRIQDGLEERGVVGVDVKVATVAKIPYFIDQTDIIVSSLSLEEGDYSVPIINGIPLLTGKGSGVVEEIIAKLDLKGS